jgi:hypothetical protein
MRALPSIVGRKYNKLLVLKYTGRSNKHGKRYVLCLCECGNRTETIAGSVVSGICKSCGCLNNKPYKYLNGQRDLPEFSVWKDLRNRCNNPRNKGYHLYGGRGIQVCERWDKSFDAFYADMGPRPSDLHSIDRKNNNGNYEPGNCHWATAPQQTRNQRTNHYFEWKGRRMILPDWSVVLGIDYQVLYMRLRNGWDLDRAFTARVISKPGSGPRRKELK